MARVVDVRAADDEDGVDDEDGAGVTEGAPVVAVGDVSAASPHEITDTVMSNAATTRRIELFTQAAIVIG